MKCENIFCIYWLNEKCILKEISLDIQGNCECCIHVNIDESFLKSQREKLLKEYEND